MGCSGPRATGHEEQCLIFAEKRLGLHLKHVSEVHLELTKDSVDGKMKSDRMDQFVRYLRLSIQGPEAASRLEAMFGFFKKEDGYSLEFLTVCGCLLSMGSTSEKASVLFHHFVEANGKKLTREQVHKIMSIMFSISIDYIPELLFASRVNIKPDVIKNYIQSLSQTRDLALNVLVFELMGHSEIIQKVSFIMKITQSKLRNILEPTGIRKFILSLDSIEQLTPSKF